MRYCKPTIDVALGQSLIGLPQHFDAFLRHRPRSIAPADLLRQAHGFEGLGQLVGGDQANDPPGPEGERGSGIP